MRPVVADVKRTWHLHKPERGLVAQIKVKHITARLADMDLSVLSRIFFPPSNSEAIKKKRKATPFVSYHPFFSLFLVLVSPSVYLGKQVTVECKKKLNVGSYLIFL